MFMPKPFAINNVAEAVEALGEKEVIWHPLTMMPVIADLLDGYVTDTAT
jgi:hypothetical protein